MRALTNVEAFALAITGNKLSEGWSKWYTIRPAYLKDIGGFRHAYPCDELNEWLDNHNEDGNSIRLIYNFDFKLQFKDQATEVIYLLKFGA